MTIERSMTYITTGERIGYERGKVEEGKRLILRLLQKRVGALPEDLSTSVQSLNVTQLETLGEALLDFTGIEDLVHWVEANRSE